MPLFEPKTPVFFGADAQQIEKVRQLLQDYAIKYKETKKANGTEFSVPRSKGDQCEYLVREMKQGRMRWKNEN